MKCKMMMEILIRFKRVMLLLMLLELPKLVDHSLLRFYSAVFMVMRRIW